MSRYVILTLLALGLAGCATVQAPYMATLRQCTQENGAMAFIPDFGITHDLHVKKCMRQSGWERTGFAGYRRADQDAGRLPGQAGR